MIPYSSAGCSLQSKTKFLFLCIATSAILNVDSFSSTVSFPSRKTSSKTSEKPSAFRCSSDSITCLNNSNEREPKAMVYDTIMRYELKKEILECADTFQKMQEEMFKLKDLEAEAKKKVRKNFRKRNLVRYLFKGKMGKREGTDNLDDDLVEAQRMKMKGLFGASSFGTDMITLGDKGEEIVAVAERLAEFNPTTVPTYGWQGYRGGNPELECVLDGDWKLSFTTAGDATFRDSPKRGKTSTSQEINAKNGTLTNVIDFEKGNVEGLRVVVEGTAISDVEFELMFKEIIIQRSRKLLFFFEKIRIPVPSFQILKTIAKLASLGKANPKKGGFQIKYIDDDFLLYKTNSGNWFVQTKLNGDETTSKTA